MSPTPTLNNSNQKPSEVKNLTIEIEPSYPLIVAITEFFRVQKMPQKALELCQMGLNSFPGDLGLRLGLAICYLDLSEKDKAGTEIMAVVQELTQLAPILASIAKQFREQGQKELGEWFHQLSLSLSKPPEGSRETKGDPAVLSLFPEEEFQTRGNSPVHENSPQEELEPQNFSRITPEKISPFFSGKNTGEKERPQDLPDSNILSTLTGWLSHLKESKA